MKFWVSLFLLISFLLNYLYAQESAKDLAEDDPAGFESGQAVSSYEKVLESWTTPEEISLWVQANFRYDHERAFRFSENRRDVEEGVRVLSPWEFFDAKSGVCLDLSRFCLETLARISPESKPRYLLISFEPVEIKGNTFRQHWMVSFRKKDEVYFFCDSHRPGHMAGPYSKAEDFIQEYGTYRGRKVVSFQELDTYERKKRQKQSLLLKMLSSN